MDTFEGFPQEAFAFLAAIRVNNNREFFEENRRVYETALRGPLIALTQALAETVLGIDPQFDVRPARTVSRIHRDLRFRRDKTPYRDWMWLGFRHTGEDRMETCGFYFDLSADAAHWGCGFYHMQPDTMRNFRAKLLAEPSRVRGIVEDEALLRAYAIKGDAYVRQHRPPEGMPESLAALYPKKSIYIEHEAWDLSILRRADLAERIAEDFKTAAPFYTLLRECMVKRITEVDI